MDSIHDVGGRQGFGPIEVTQSDPAFSEKWEGRAFGIAKSMTSASDYNTDKFRFTREQLPPLEYLTAPYFMHWYRSSVAMLVGSGLVTAPELGAGKSESDLSEDVGPPRDEATTRQATSSSMRYDGEYSGEPKFVVADHVTTSSISLSGHTRLPQYARGRIGKIVSYHGAHVVPDDSVRNIKTFEPLYTVEFALSDLFEEHANSHDVINLEVWERFLEFTE